MSEKLLLDEHYSEQIAERVRRGGHDVRAIVSQPELRAQPDSEIFGHAAAADRRLVTENVKDFRPLLQQAYATGDRPARLLFVPPNRFPRGAGRRSTAIVDALSQWLTDAARSGRPDEGWLVER